MGIKQIALFRQVVEAQQPNNYILEPESGAVHGWYRFSNAPLPGDRLMHMWEDISDLKMAEQEVLRLKDAQAKLAIDKSEEKYHTLFTSMDEGVTTIELIFDEDGHAVDAIYIDSNPAIMKQTGLSPDIIGMRIKKVAPNLEPFWLETYERVVKTGKPERFEYESGDIGAWFSVYASRVGEPGSNQIVAVYNNITERKKEQQRQDYLMRLNDALRDIHDAVAIQKAAAETAIDYFATERCYYCEIIGDIIVVSRDAFKGDLPSVVGTYPLNSFALYKQVIDEGLPFVVHNSHTTGILDESLRAICIQLKIISFINVPVIKNGIPVGIFCFVQSTPRNWTSAEVDLAQETVERTWAAVERARAEETLRQSEQQLKQLLKLRDEFIGVASHELKTPITSIKAYAEIVQERLEEIGNVSESNLIGRLNAQIVRLTVLINNLLDTSRIAEGTLILTLEPLDINQLLKERTDEIAYTTGNALNLVTEGLPPVMADKERIGQVITNLLSNAIKYSPKDSTIIISAINTGNSIRVSVQDEGVGISEADQRKVFDRFFRVTANDMDTYPGMGLGLYISAQIIQRHNGTISVKSELEKGSVFSFTIPYKA